MTENGNNNYQLIINNKEICDFFKENPAISIEESLLLVIEILQKLFNKMSDDLSTNVNSQILNFLNDNKNKMEKMSVNMQTVSDNINKMTNDITNNIMLEFFKIKKDYIEEMTRLLENFSLQSKEKMELLIGKSGESLLDKTTLLLNNLIPKNQSENKEMFHNAFQGFQHLVVDETKKLITTNDQHAFQQFLASFDSKYTTLLQNLQQPLYSVISSTEERLVNNLNVIKENTNSTFCSQDKIFGELSEFLGKYKISTNKGKYGEQQLFELLTTTYPSAEIKNTSGQKASGDFIMVRSDKNPIMFENKEYDQNVNKDEITKFIRDIDVQNMHGIFMSQYSGISFKNNFEIEIHKGNVLIYIHNCNYSSEKIKSAVDIIDHLAIKIQDLNIDENHSISKEILDNINEDYKQFLEQKETTIQLTKDFQKKLIVQIENLKMPNLDKYLEPKYAQIRSKGFTCDICNNYFANTKQSLAAHKRGCARKQANN
tara:strand:- start:9522 stop:10979 length:1458 start_codon:yes stop_codon:yes gene_type:complete